MSGTGTARGRGGFTLIEVLLTILIMGWMLVAVTQVLTLVRQDRDRIHNIQEAQLAGPAILDRIDLDLRSLLTYDLDARFHLRIDDRSLSGYDADSLDFVCTTDSLIPLREEAGEAFRGADVNEVGYRLRQHPEFDDFLEIYRREDFGIDEEPHDGGRFSLLHDRVKGFDIEIYEEDGPEAEPLTSWGSADTPELTGLPARIEISLTIELAPRLVREQLITDRRLVTYKRVVRFPESLRTVAAAETAPVPEIPDLQPPSSEASAGPGGGPGGPGGPAGGPGQPFPEGGEPGAPAPEGAATTVEFGSLEGGG